MMTIYYMSLIETEWPERIVRRPVAVIFKQILYLFVTFVKHTAHHLCRPTAYNTKKLTSDFVLTKCFMLSTS